MVIKEFSEELVSIAAKLCRQNMELDIMPDFLLREKTFGEKDYNPFLTLVAFDEKLSEPIGFIQAVVKQRMNEKIGYIKILCVDVNNRRKGIGTILHNNVVEKIKLSGINKIRLCESFPNYLMPGIDKNYTEGIQFFNKLGYKKFKETVNLSADLSVQKFETQAEELNLEHKGITTRRAIEIDRTNVIEFIKKYFYDWREEVESTFDNQPITLFIAEKDKKIIGFSAHEGNNKGRVGLDRWGTKKVFVGWVWVRCF